jgi:mannosyltransferase
VGDAEGRPSRYPRLPGGNTLALLGVLLLAGALRLYGLEIQSLWVDELASVRYSDPEDPARIISLSRTDVHPPGYYLPLGFARDLLGDAEWALRLPSAVAGVLAVLAVYLLGRRLYSEREGLIAALFTAVLLAPVHYAQEARSYSLLLLFSVLAAYFWWGVLTRLRASRRPTLADVMGYVASAAVCCYLHYFGLILVAMQGAALLLLAPRAFRSVVLLYLPVALAYLPWLPAMEGQMRDKPPGAPSFLQYLDFLFNYSTALQLLVAGLFALALARAREDLKKADAHGSPDPVLRGGLLLAWFLGPFAVAYLIAEYHSPILTSRNLIVALPAAYLLLARAVTRAFAGNVAQLAVAGGLAGLFLAHLLFSVGYYDGPRKQQVREAVGFVVENERPDALVAHCGVGPSSDYYYEYHGSDRHGMEHVGACTAERMDVVQKRVREGGHRYVILVHAHLRPEAELVEALGGEYDLVREERLRGAGARLYEVGPDSP